MQLGNIGNRIKRYESVTRQYLLPRSYIVLRVDGKAFHTFTKDMNKPFDDKLIEAMVRAGERVAAEMQGFKIGYHQSDEFTFILTDKDTYESQLWFDGNIQKLCSVTASLFGAYFNNEMGGTLAAFDCRAFNVPADDIANVIVWRQRDWERNSVQMLARTYFSQKELNHKRIEDIHEMLYTKNINWAMIKGVYKNGTIITKNNKRLHIKMTYSEINELLDKLQTS